VETRSTFELLPEATRVTDQESTQLFRMEHKLDATLEWINGDDSDQKPGAKVRMDRLEQAEKRRQAKDDRLSAWLMTLFCGGGVTAAVAVWALVQAVKR
jgi:hypothetical protein